MRAGMPNQSLIRSLALIVMVVALLLALPQTSNASVVTAVLCAPGLSLPGGTGAGFRNTGERRWCPAG
jgi:hypothetical protein